MLPSSLRITGTAFRQALRTSLPLAAGATPGAGARGHYATNMQPSAASHPSATTPGQPTRPLQEFFSAARQAVREGKVNEHNPETVARLAALMGEPAASRRAPPPAASPLSTRAYMICTHIRGCLIGETACNHACRAGARGAHRSQPPPGPCPTQNVNATSVH